MLPNGVIPSSAVAAYFTREGLAIPYLLIDFGLPPEVAWDMPAYRAFRFKAWVQMDEKIRHATEVRVEDCLQLFHLPVDPFQGKFSREDQVEINMDQPSGSPSPQPVNIDP